MGTGLGTGRALDLHGCRGPGRSEQYIQITIAVVIIIVIILLRSSPQGLCGTRKIHMRGASAISIADSNVSDIADACSPES
jgi:hypothetical protein